MSKKIVIVDYQLSNLFSVKQAFYFLGYNALISSSPEDLKNADFAILPGVGAFADAMKNLNDLGLVDGIKDFINAGKPFMGVCLGQQLILSRSEEFENTKGLELVKGVVKKFPFQKIGNRNFKVPQIQWNKICEPTQGKWINSPLSRCNANGYLYFVHSYYTELENKQDVLASTSYGNLTYCSSILQNNIFTTQFHPEKSGLLGLDIYKNWLKD